MRYVVIVKAGKREGATKIFRDNDGTTPCPACVLPVLPGLSGVNARMELFDRAGCSCTHTRVLYVVALLVSSLVRVLSVPAIEIRCTQSLL